MAKFKQKADIHQINFKKEFITKDSGFYIRDNTEISSPHFLPENYWKNGLNYVDEFRDEIKTELKEFNNKMRDANMLRSEHIPLNIFVPMVSSLNLTKQLFNTLLGNDIIESVLGIHIEMAGGKTKAEYDKKLYLDDGTSFDCRIDFIHKDGKDGYLGIEVKYTEEEYKIKSDSKEYKDIWKRENNKYQIVTNKSEYYIGDKYDELKQDKFRQIWRNHILGASMVHFTKEIDHFYHIHLYPQGNEHFVEIIPKYQELLSEKGRASFLPITYEELFCEMEKLFCENEKHTNWIKYLKARYLF